MKLVRRLLVSALAAVTIMTASCATLESNPNTAALVTEYATAKVIEIGKTPADRLVRAARIKAIASDAKTWLDGGAVTIDFLQAAAQERIAKLGLAPADTMLANALLQTVVQELLAKVGAGVISPDKLTTVNQLLGWVILATEMYGA